MHTIAYNKWKPLLVQNGADIIAALFILLFAYTGINKLLSINSFNHVLKDYPLIGGYASLVAWWIPIAELIVVIWLFIPATRKLGLYASVVLMMVFTAYVLYLVFFTTKKYCTCGGMLQALSWTEHIIFNMVFIILGITAIFLNRKKPT